MARPRLSERLYRLLLRCYPGEFRDEYEREMMLAFHDRLSAERGLGAAALLRLWGQILVDSFARAPREHLDVLRQDVTYAVRSLRAAPVFALAAIATLAVGVGANTAIFSVVHAVALRPLPYEAADRLIRVWERNDALSISGFSVSLPNYVSWRERARTVELAAWRGGSATVRASGDPFRVLSATIAPDYFTLLGARPIAGRVLASGDDVPGAPPVAVIRDSLWRSQFASDPSIVGRTVTIGDRAHSIVGVVAERDAPLSAEIYMPLMPEPAADRSNHIASVIGRVRPGFSVAAAEQELASIARQLEAEFPAANKGWGIEVSTVYDWLVPPETRRALYVLLVAVGCVLLIACANVATLMLTRASARRREIALRMAMGAARRRVVRQVLTEGMTIALAGGTAGVLLAYWTVSVARKWLPATLPRADEVSVDATVLLFSLALCVITGLAFAVLPALASSRGDAIGALKDGARGSSGGHRSRRVLAAAQVALATMLLVGAGLLAQTLARLQRVDLGFEPRNITTGMLGLQPNRFTAPGSGWTGFYGPFLERLASSPGVEGVALSSGAPFGGGNTGMPINAAGDSNLGVASLQTDWRMVSPDYFRTMRIPLLRGRYFSSSSATGEQNNLIASASMARAIWGDRDPIGRQIKAGPNGIFTVVGVVGDVRQLDLSADPAPTMYLSTTRYLWPTMTVVVRGDARAQAAAVLRNTLRELDPQLAVFNVREMEQLIAESAAQPRLNAWLLGAFAGIAALLASIGVYGVLGYAVSQRRQEIGIRMALGATRAAVVRNFLVQGAALAAVGLGAGVAGSIAVSRWMAALLFQVEARDPWTIGAAVAVVATVVAVASYVPARRAAAVNPLVALRAE